jgi:hypothetical protein
MPQLPVVMVALQFLQCKPHPLQVAMHMNSTEFVAVQRE